MARLRKAQVFALAFSFYQHHRPGPGRASTEHCPMTTTDPTGAKRAARHADARRAAGEQRLCTWQPRRLVAQLHRARRGEERLEDTVRRLLESALAAGDR